jgi:cytochrome c553
MKLSLGGIVRIGVLLSLTSALAHGAGWIEQRGAGPIRGDVAAGEAKATVCVACHGPNGNALVPAFPRLAGQRADYLYWELVKYKHAARPDSPMTPQVAPLSDGDMRDLAAYFAAQTPQHTPPVQTPDTGSLGARIFEFGRVESGTPACRGCHGANAEGGTGDLQRDYPVLRGQHKDFLVQRLKDYRDGKLAVSSNDFIMHGVAVTLDDDAIDAVAGWLSSL